MARTHVVMADEVLEAIDQVAGERGRSRFIEEAAKEKLDRIRLVKALERSAGIAKQGYEYWKDRKAAAAWVRQTRASENRR